jgi:hypothetical protein
MASPVDLKPSPIEKPFSVKEGRQPAGKNGAPTAQQVGRQPNTE